MQQREGKFHTKTYHEICKEILILEKNEIIDNNQVPSKVLNNLKTPYKVNGQ